ncbi:MAG: metallophosphoesterase family protein [Candidatus Omnitrophica bacterium]|nr:metallophosphoesterase family protein [Candidatus Omnitrophota bacterium]
MTRIGVISDTHIPDRADNIPKQVIEEFKKVDMILHAGDIAELSVLQKLKSLCKDVHAVWGNMDPAEVKKTLSSKEIIKVGNHKIGLAHGEGPADRIVELLASRFKDDKVDIIVFGHSHKSYNQTRNGILFFNPGSPTDKVFSAYNSYGIIEINDNITARIIKI